MNQSYARWNLDLSWIDLSWTESYVHTHPLELNAYLEKKKKKISLSFFEAWSDGSSDVSKESGAGRQLLDWQN